MLKLNRLLIVPFIMIGCIKVTCAEVTPKGTKFDKRITTVTYNVDDVVRVNVAEGVSTLIQLDKTEVLTTNNAGMGLGDPLAWNVSVRANNIFIRPIAEQPDTNVTLVTNKRTYILSLRTVSSVSRASWLVRFDYPDTLDNSNENRPTPCTTGFVNWEYFKKGDDDIAPLAVWDDGRFTCMSFSATKDLPVVYRVMDDNKTEVLANYHFERDVLVVHEVSNQFVLRMGQRVIAIKTNDIKHQTYNDEGTTTGEKRVKIND